MSLARLVITAVVVKGVATTPSPATMASRWCGTPHFRRPVYPVGEWGVPAFVRDRAQPLRAVDQVATNQPAEPY